MKPPFNQQLEDGFALPIAIGVGVVMILIATTMVIRSNQSQVASISQRSNNNSLAAAETGVAQYLSLFNRYRAFATSHSDDWDDRRADIQARPGCSGSGLPASQPDYADAEVTNFFDPTAEGRWVQIDSSDSDKGRFRLIDYEVNPTSSRGTLRIEGADGRDPDNSRTALTRLEVEFPLLGLAVSPVSAGFSTTECRFSAINLPITTSLNAFVSSENNDVPNVSYSDTISSTITGDSEFPRSGDPDVENYTYVLSGDPAINLNAGEVLRINNGKTVYLVAEEDIIVNEGQIQLETGAKLYVISAGNVILTQRAGRNRPVVFSRTENQPAASESFQVFLTGIDTDLSTVGNDEGELVISTHDTIYSAPTTSPPPVPASSNFTTLSFVAYAPDGSVQLNKISNSDIRFVGSVWAKNFSLSSPNPPTFTSQNVTSPDLPVFWKARLDTTQISKRLGSMNSWKKIEIP